MAERDVVNEQSSGIAFRLSEDGCSIIKDVIRLPQFKTAVQENFNETIALVRD